MKLLSRENPEKFGPWKGESQEAADDLTDVRLER